jgi:hypothetical protein
LQRLLVDVLFSVLFIIQAIHPPPLSRVLIPSCSVLDFQSVQVLIIIQRFSFPFFSNSLTHSSCWRPVILHYWLLLCARSLFRFGGGRPLHKVQYLVVSNPLETPISNLRAFLMVLLNSLFCHRCSLRPLSLNPLLHSGPFHSLSSKVPFRGSCSVLSVV